MFYSNEAAHSWKICLHIQFYDITLCGDNITSTLKVHTTHSHVGYS
jgi:hypothetical protein